MKPVIWIGLAAVVAGAGFMFLPGLQEVEHTATGMAEEAAVLAREVANEAGQAVVMSKTGGKDAADATGKAVDSVAGTVAGAAKVAKNAAEDAAKALAKTAGDTAGVVANAVSPGLGSTKKAGADAMTGAAKIETQDQTDDLAANASEPATGSADSVASGGETRDNAAPEAVGPSRDHLADLFTVDGFDHGKAVAAVQDSGLSVVQKATILTGLEKARDNPDLLMATLDQIRTAMGL